MNPMSAMHRVIAKPLRGLEVILAVLLVLGLALPCHARNLKVAWNANPETWVSGYIVHYGTSTLNYTTHTNVGNATTVTLSGLIPGGTYYFSVTAYDALGNQSMYAREVRFQISPGILGLQNLNFGSSQTPQLLNFTLDGGDIAPNWTVGALTTNTSVLPSSSITLSGSSINRSLTITPTGSSSGTTTLGIYSTDGFRTNFAYLNVSLSSQTVNLPPTLDPISNRTVSEDPGTQVVTLTGIGSGALTESQSLTVSAVSSNPSLIPNPVISYSSPNSTASLSFTPLPNQNGTTLITVTVDDGQSANATVQRTFTITVLPINDPPTLDPISDVSMSENTTAFPVALTGITPGSGGESQTVTITATSSDPSILPNPVVTYASPSTTGTLILSPVTNITGNVSVTVTADDGQSQNHAIQRTFNVAVNPINHAPVVLVGTNATVAPNVSLMVRARITDDGLPLTPGKVTARWAKISGPGTVTIGNSNAALTTMRFTNAGLYRLRLTGNDGELSSFADLFVFVRTNIDFTPPTITNIAIAEITSTSATLTWSTDEASTEQVEFTSPDGIKLFTAMNLTLGLNHRVVVTNLSPGTVYTMRARSRDGSANQTYSKPVVLTTLRTTPVFIPSDASNAVLSDPAILVPDGGQRSAIQFPDATSGSAAFSFTVPSAGDYFVWARLKAPSADSDSFSISVDGSQAASFSVELNGGAQWSSQWQWMPISTVHLATGTHILTLGALEAGVTISRLLFTAQSDVTPDDAAPIIGSLTALTLSEPLYLIPLKTGWSMIANPLSTSATDIASLFPDLAAGSKFMKFDSSSGGYVTNEFDGAVWSSPDMTLNPGEGGLFYNVGNELTWGVTGTLGTPTLLELATGLNLVALRPGVAGLLSETLSNYTFHAGDEVYRLDWNTGGFLTYTFDGTYWDSTPSIDLGESLFIRVAP